MRGKIALTLAVSLDGYIADEDGGYGWITGQGNNRLDTEQKHSFPDFLKEVDIVVMGMRCFEQGFAEDFADKQVYVATNARREDTGNIAFIGGDVVEVVLRERDRGKRIYLFGGGVLIDPFLKADAIDEYSIGIVPVILGKGRPLFLGGCPVIALQVDGYTLQDGIFEIRYSRRGRAGAD